ncbi:MAG: DUF503 domain-containing protein [Dehalococcoidales bacterium]|jgi:uncharacterized protein YlxP (DUF503 family)|nr:DUF503 domain-containing protein [Dehalococcoidales bacterium]MDX9986179.1 DUF503 domain-containing protein [Dehalococcoidales bacterium]NLE89695.1 DUF503 domain-containing protein [Dehalococcoidales bacterium]
MHVGIIKIYLRLAGNNSLKGKRQAIRPMIAGLRKRYNVSVAEVADQDRWQSAVIGISLVTSDKRMADEVISSIQNDLNSGRFNAEVIENQVEIIPV